MTDQERQELLETIRNFRLIDDTYFNIYMDGNPRDMEFILRIIENDPGLQVIDLYTQREVPNLYGRGVRFDVFVKSAAGVEYNIEIQRDSNGASPERARFNSSMLDARVVQKGFKWGKDHLPPAKVIFITEHDTEGTGKPLYHVHRYVDELNKKPFKDQAEIVYVNASYQDDSPLGRLMHDMNCKNPDDMYYPELAARANYFKTNEHGVSQMCKAMEDLVNDMSKERVEQARIEARLETEQNTILRLLADGAGIPLMATASGWSIERVTNFLKSRNLRPAQ